MNIKVKHSNITYDTRPVDIPALKPYSKWLLYCGETEGKQDVELTFRENQKSHSNRNAESMLQGMIYLEEQALQNNVLYSVYPETEWQESPEKEDVKLFFLPAEDRNTDKPFIICAAGGGYIRVCSMGESFPAAKQFHKLGYHVFVLNYRVLTKPVFPTVLDDMAAAIRFILENQNEFGLKNTEYILNGYSAGGNLVDAFGTEALGWKKYDLPAPAAIFSVYAPLAFRDGGDVREMFTENYPPCFIIHAKDDPTVPYQNAVDLKQLCDKYHIPAQLELPEHGEHGWGDGRDTDAEGWTERAIAFLEVIRICKNV